MNRLGFVYDEKGYRIEPDVPIRRVRSGNHVVCSVYAGVDDWHVWYEEVRKGRKPDPKVGDLSRDVLVSGWSKMA